MGRRYPVQYIYCTGYGRYCVQLPYQQGIRLKKTLTSINGCSIYTTAIKQYAAVGSPHGSLSPTKANFDLRRPAST